MLHGFINKTVSPTVKSVSSVSITDFYPVLAENNKGSDEMAISNTLKDIREERNLVQADLAKAVGPCSDTIGRIERGERSASLEIAIRLARFLNMNVEDIFTLDEATSAHQKTGV